ncbi:O-acetyltransferase OatA-like [Symsagittifera roscoffensis]|uniref:O-acetyltransferase OatA-like n=1 Tax=Symsagittifera roscoffensis TaxID=84072 RepID=UPI00307C60F2
MKDQYQSKSSKLAYRKHLDAIRGLACVAVVLFHCKVPFMVNGWIGVDMFFVLSGFLITSILLRELLESDRLNFRRFYCRRFVRLFPASATVLGITAVLFRYTEMPQYVRMHKQSFVASALYFQNWHGLSIALDYFTDEGSDQSPVIHFWSLSIEEQFYAVFPLFLSATFFVFRRKTTVMLSFFLFCAVIFTAENVYLASQSPMISYFSTWGRLYQFSLGSVISLLLLITNANKSSIIAAKMQSPVLKSLADVLSLAVLACSAYLATVAKLSPLILGTGSALLTFLLIILLEISDDDNLIKRSLYLNPSLCFLGKLSYGMYLIHLPLTKLGDINAVLPTEGPFRPVAIFLLTVSLAAMMKKLIEDPFKKECSKLQSRRTLAIFLFLTIIQPIILIQILSDPNDRSVSYNYKFPNKLDLIDITRNLSDTSTFRNLSGIDPALAKYCELLPVDRSLLIVGDSYAAHWKEVFLELHDACNIKANYGAFWKPGAPYFPVYMWKVAAGKPEYKEALKKDPNFIANPALEYLKENKTDISLYFSRCLHNSDIQLTKDSPVVNGMKNLDGWKEMIQKAFPDFIERVSQYTTPVIMIMHQRPNGNPTECIKRLQNQKQDLSNLTNACPITVNEEPGVSWFRDYLKELQKTYEKLLYIDMGQLFIGNFSRPTIISGLFEGVPVFKDGIHISKEFVFKKMPVLLEELRRQKML